MDNNNDNPRFTNNVFYSIYKFLLPIVKSFLCGALLALTFATFFGFTEVSGESMNPTLHTSDFILMESLSKKTNSIDRGDIISFRKNYKEVNTEPIYYIKRVIAIGGDTIDITDGHVYLNGKQLKEKYIPYGVDTKTINNSPMHLTLKENEFFVLGDNRNNSLDSRFPEVGVIPLSAVKDVVLLRVLNG